ncbi:hypothetical protein TPELB_24570 [Terrisporobacter petrolearius]|uniref:Uncharacterized protein n=1 Tax=Terrisporobacter petrolearius TaxID=1460447 RepID=A0ABZ3FGM4_9FIRM
MTNDKLIKLNRILLGIIVSLTILLILLFIFLFFNIIGSEIVLPFISVYIVSFLLFWAYVFIATLIQLKNLNKKDRKIRIVKFIKGFLAYFLFMGLTSLFFRPNNIDFFNIFCLPIAGSFGFNFLDLLFFRNTSKSNWY